MRFYRSRRAYRDAMIRRRRHADAMRVMRFYRDASRYYRDATIATATADGVVKLSEKLAKEVGPEAAPVVKSVGEVSSLFTRAKIGFKEFIYELGVRIRRLPGKIKQFFMPLYNKLHALFTSMKKREVKMSPEISEQWLKAGYKPGEIPKTVSIRPGLGNVKTFPLPKAYEQEAGFIGPKQTGMQDPKFLASSQRSRRPGRGPIG